MTTYYFIKDKGLLGKTENHTHYLYIDGHWAEDVHWVIEDRLTGYDPDEEPGFRFGNSEVSSCIETITKEEAEKRLSLLERKL